MRITPKTALAFATLTLVLMAACDRSEPLAPVTTLQTALLFPYEDTDTWAATSVETKQSVWDSAQAEFARLRARQDFTGLLRLAREVHHLYPEERRAWVDLSTALWIMRYTGRGFTAANGALNDELGQPFSHEGEDVLRARAWSNLASLHMDLAQTEKALVAADQAIAQREDFAPSHLRRGEALRALGRHAEAAASYRRALELSPRIPDIVSSDIIAYALSQREVGDLEGAEETLRIGIAEMPGAFGLHHHRAIMLQGLGRLDEAFAEHSLELILCADSPYVERARSDLGAVRGAAIQAQFQDSNVPMSLPMSLPAMSSFEFAQEAASGTIETDHADDSVPGEGVPMQERLRMLSFAEDTFNLGSTHNWETLYADSPPAVSLFCAYRAATMHRTLEEYEEAERWHRKALEVDPNFIPSLVDLAELARLRDDDEQDLELLTRAWMIDPTSWRLRSHLEYRPGLVDELEWRALEAVDASREAEEN